MNLIGMLYMFAVSPDEIKLDRRIGNRLEVYIHKAPRNAVEGF
jgi:hypothetical protein